MKKTGAKISAGILVLSIIISGCSSETGIYDDPGGFDGGTHLFGTV